MPRKSCVVNVRAAHARSSIGWPVAALILGVLAAGCGSNDAASSPTAAASPTTVPASDDGDPPPDDAPTPTPTPTSKPTVTTTEPTTSPESDTVTPDAIDVCSLLTWEEVEAWTEFPRSPDDPEASEGFFGDESCTWWTEPDPEAFRGRGLILTVWPSNERASSVRVAIEGMLELQDLDREPIVDTSGLPGEPFVLDGIGAGTFLSDDLAIYASTFGIGGPAEDTSIEQQIVEFEAVKAAAARLLG